MKWILVSGMLLGMVLFCNPVLAFDLVGEWEAVHVKDRAQLCNGGLKPIFSG